MSVLDPLSHAFAAVVVAADTGLTSLDADPASGVTWLLSIAAVVVVRVLLLPLAVQGVRVAHSSARARPQLQELAQRYRNRKDPESLRAFAVERRRIAAEHDMPRLGWLPLLVQLPVWFALYHLMAQVAMGTPVGAMSHQLVASSNLVADVPEAVTRAQQLMPALSAVGLLVAGGVVPVALLVYWVCNSLWTPGQSAVVWRWFPTPGSPAALRSTGH
jgi:YidC/Oxa1 family membrane protein insertase